MAEPAKKPAASTPAQSAPPPKPETTTPPEGNVNSMETKPDANVMSDADRDELEQYRAERARREALASSTETIDGKPNLDLDPVKDRDAFLELSVENQIRAHYLHARGTIQDYARIFKLEVNEVLHILGHDDMVSVDTIGDLVDQKELGPNAKVNPHGQIAEANYTVN